MTLKPDGSVMEIEIFDEPNLIIEKKECVGFNIDDSKCKFKLGDRVKHTINGFEGIVSAITTYHGEIMKGITISPTKLFDGKPIENQNFAERILIKITEQEKKEPSGKRTGGPQKIPIMMR